ncbi:hypothetical protein BKA83DRAFT_4178322 [Pisolithus microcarpus]|nr:hypothetical protein BKA83DRAFT_4178322 [Pisolithus microcarpus]
MNRIQIHARNAFIIHGDRASMLRDRDEQLVGCSGYGVMRRQRGTRYELMHERHTCERRRCTNSQRHGTRDVAHAHRLQYGIQGENGCSGSVEMPQLQISTSKPRFKAPKPSSMLPKSWFMEDVDRRASHTDRIELAQEEMIRTSVDRRIRRASDVL